jgi:hypothetical protein
MNDRFVWRAIRSLTNGKNQRQAVETLPVIEPFMEQCPRIQRSIFSLLPSLELS